MGEFSQIIFFPKKGHFIPCSSGLNRVLGLMNLGALLPVLFLVKKHSKIDKKIQNRSNIQKVNENEKHPKNVKQVQNRADFSKVNKNDKIRVDPTLIKKIPRSLIYKNKFYYPLVRVLTLIFLGL
jgi:hypothetical protein